MKTINPHLALVLILLYFSMPSNGQSGKINYQNGNVSITESPTLLGQKQKPAFWRVYMWEFGDGHYAYKVAKNEKETPPRVKHAYENKQSNRNLKLHLTPVYSTTPATTISTSVSKQNQKKGRPDDNYKIIKKKKQVGIFTNSFWNKKFDDDPKIVPGNDVQVVIHYKSPSNDDGYLAFFYDDELIEDISTSRVRKYYGEKTLRSNHFDNNPNLLKTPERIALSKLEKEYGNSSLLFECKNLKGGKEQRLFLTMKLRENIDEDLIDENEKIEIKAMWIPKSGSFDKGKCLATYEMDIVSYHDPNRIQVSPRRLFYRKGFPKELTYKVSFENVGDGIVGNVRIEVELDKNVDVNTFKLDKIEPEGLKLCPANFSLKDTTNMRCVVVEKLPSTGKDKLIFTIYNSNLLGTDDKKKYRKGFIKFKVSSNNHRKKRTSATADIIFGNNKPISTRASKTKWKMKSLHLKAGLNLTSDVLAFNFDEIDPLDAMSFGLYFQNAPLGRGFSHSVDISLTGSQFSRDSNYVLSPSSLVPSGGWMSLSETGNIKFLEAQYQLGYQFGGGLRIFAGTGVSTIAFGELEVTGDVRGSNNVETPIILANEVVKFGLFENADFPSIFNQPIEPVTGVGLIGSLGIEVGALNHFTFGLSNQFRYYPKFYHENCTTVFNWNAYVRFKIFTIGSRG